MMQPRLRATVTYLRTDQGMLFRNGDTFLPINGSRLWDLFQMAKPMLECRQSEETHSPELEMLIRGPLAKVLEALKAADMLYEAEHDVPEGLSHEALSCFRRERARLETKSDSPLTKFSQAREKRVLIAAQHDLAVEIADAALQTGLRNLIFLVSGWNSEVESQLLERSEGYRADGDDAKIEVHAWDATLLKETEWDELLVAGNLAQDRSLVLGAMQALSGRPQSCGIAMYAMGSRIIVCGCDAYAGCPTCIEETLPDDTGIATHTDASVPRGWNVIGAQLLLRQFWDVQLEGPDSIARHTLMEFDFRTHRIVRRPRPVCQKCRDRSASSAAPIEIQKLPISTGDDSLRNLDFCKRAEPLCVDSQTGILRVLEEGSLLQYPFHQCAARLEDCDADRDSPWLEECGEEMLEARAGTIRRALERFYERRFLRLYADHAPTWLHDSSGTRRPAAIPELHKEGVTVAAESWQELVHQSLYRALAKYSHAQSGWTVMNDLAQMPDDPEVRMVSEYLKDIGHLDGVLVCKRSSSRADGICQLRFHYHGQPISVVAGTDWVHAWKTGLQDIWMYVSASDTRSVEEHQKPPAIKFRAACGARAQQQQLHEIGELENRLGLRLCLFPIGVDASMKLLSLSFAHACLAPVTAEGGIADDVEESISALHR